MKKIISLVLVFCMLFSLGVSAFADDQGEGPTQTASGGGESGGDSGGTESGGASGGEPGGSGGGESGGASGGEPGGSGGGESGGASGGTESGGGSGGGESGGGDTGGGSSGGGESGGASGGGTSSGILGNVVVDNAGSTVTVGGVAVTFDASGQGSISQVTKDDDGVVTVTGSVTSTGITVDVSGGSEVTVVGDTFGGKKCIEATDGSTVEITGFLLSNDNGVTAEGGSEVTVDGDIQAGRIGIDAKGDGTVVNVAGYVESSAGTGITAADGAAVEVAGNVKGSFGYGVTASNGAEIDIGGNVEGSKAGILVEIAGAEGEKASTILVEGTVSATGQNANAIQLNIKDGAAEEKVLETLPEIITKTVVPDADIAVVAGSGVDTDKVKQSLLDQVRYVVNMDTVYEPGAENTNLTVALVRVDGVLEDKTLKANAGTEQEKTLTVATSSTIMNVVVDKGGSIVGVDVSGGEGHKVEANDDGSYKITVGKGVLNIVARVDKAVSPQPEPEPLPDDPDPVKPDPVKPDPSQRSETVQVRQETVSTAWVKLDYGHKNPLENILIIDMTTTNVAVFLTHTLRTFNRRNAIGTVMIKVAYGSFTISANDLLQLLGSEAACALIAGGDMLEIRVGDETVASLVMTSTK